MKLRPFPVTVIAVCALAISGSASAAQRTFVASYGVDSNPCSVTQPCRTFAAAVALTSADGEVVVLDSAGYGPVTISVPVSVVAPPGVYAGISVFSGDGITVAATAAKVVLRGLTINGQGGNRGIVLEGGGLEVHIESCTVSNMAQAGIAFLSDTRGHVRNSIVRSSGSGLVLDYPGAYPPLPDGYLDVQVSDSHFSQNVLGIEIKGGSLAATRILVDKSTQHGVALTGGLSSPLSAVLTDSVLSWNNGAGVLVSSSSVLGPFQTDLQFLRSTSAHNGSWGIDIHANQTRSALAVVTDSSVVANTQGGLLASGAKATAVVTRSTLAGNGGADLSQADSAVLRTSENNTLTGRGAADVSGTLTPNPMK